MEIVTVFFLGLAAVSAVSHLTEPQPMLPKVDDILTYQYVNGASKLMEDLWTKATHLEEVARYKPDTDNVYHLFTRKNPTVSQSIEVYNELSLIGTYYEYSKRTIVLIHGWLDNATTAMNTVLVPVFLEAEDVNVIVVDWSQGAGTITYPVAVINTETSGEAVARFIAWLNLLSGSDIKKYHIVGHNLGAHQAGIVGRHLRGQAAYITGLDPAFIGWLTNDHKFKATDGQYTEVIHTNAGLLGYLGSLADVDFYPNGGVDMPGCYSQDCDSNRSFYYFAESIRTGGFNATRCSSFATAMAGQCFEQGSLHMGGTKPKTGHCGAFYLRTNSFPPFSRG